MRGFASPSQRWGFEEVGRVRSWVAFPVVPRSTSRVLLVMAVIASVEARTAAGPQRVWDRLIDGPRWSAWSASTEWMAVEGPLTRGAFVTIKRKRGRQTAYLIETADAPTRLALLLQFGPAAQMRIAWTLEPAGSGTRIVQTIESGGPLRRWLSDPLAGKAARALAGDPAQLADLAASP